MASFATAGVGNHDSIVLFSNASTLLELFESRGRLRASEPTGVPEHAAAPASDDPLFGTPGELMEAIVKSSDDAIVSKNAAGIITSWNKGAERVFGYTAEEAIGQHITLIVPNDRWNEEAENLERLRRGERISNLRTVRRKKDGSSIHVSLTISPIIDANGRIVGASKIARDITEAIRGERELKDDQERLRKLSEGLEHVVRARTRELQLISSRLLKAEDDERRRLARELHDNAGQTLAVLALKISQLTESVREKSPQVAAGLQEIHETVQHLDQQIRTTSYLLHPPLLDESGLYSALKWYVAGLSQRSGLAVQLEMREDFGRVAHEIELLVFRIVQECLTNVLRHSGAKTASIRVARDPEGSVDIEIKDEGKGMSAEKLSKLHSGVSGVGVRGMRDRVRQLNGSMKIESNSSGTRVAVHLPHRKISED